MLELKLVKKTRKDHDCIGCPKPIPKGQSAINASGLDYDEEFLNWYSHIERDCYLTFTNYLDTVEECDIEELIHT